MRSKVMKSDILPIVKVENWPSCSHQLMFRTSKIVEGLDYI